MSTELIAILGVGVTILGVGVTIVGVILNAQRSQRADIKDLRKEMQEQGVRLGKEIKEQGEKHSKEITEVKNGLEEVKNDLTKVKIEVAALKATVDTYFRVRVDPPLAGSRGRAPRGLRRRLKPGSVRGVFAGIFGHAAAGDCLS